MCVCVCVYFWGVPCMSVCAHLERYAGFEYSMQKIWSLIVNLYNYRLNCLHKMCGCRPPSPTQTNKIKNKGYVQRYITYPKRRIFLNFFFIRVHLVKWKWMINLHIIFLHWLTLQNVIVFFYCFRFVLPWCFIKLYQYYTTILLYQFHEKWLLTIQRAFKCKISSL